MYLSLCILLLLSAAAAAHAAESNAMPAPMFVDWLSGQASSKAKTASYEEVETESVCLQETKLRNCRCLNLASDDKCQRNYAESTLTCCGSYGPGSFMQEQSLASVCNWQEDLFNETVTYDGTATKKIGTFTATCEMREDSKKCGSPPCAGMTVVASGDILRYGMVAFVGYSQPEAISQDDACQGFPPQPLRGNARAGTTEMPAKIQFREEKHEEAAPMYWVAKGDIYSGTFRVTSRFHGTNYKVGQFQMTYPAYSGGTPEAMDTLPDRAYVAKANQLQLEFIKTEGY